MEKTWIAEAHRRASRRLIENVAWECLAVLGTGAACAWVDRIWPLPVPPPAEPWQRGAIGFLLALTAICILAYAWQLLIGVPLRRLATRVRFEREKRGAYRSVWRIDPKWEQAITIAGITHTVGGHVIDYGLYRKLVMLGFGVNTEDIAAEICHRYRLTDAKHKALAASAVVDFNNLLFPIGIVVTDGDDKLHLGEPAIEFDRVLALAQLRRQYGAPGRWT